MLNNKLSLIFIFCLLLRSAHSFCVYNNTNQRRIKIKQKLYHTSANTYSAFKNNFLPPGDRDCCPYTNSDCSGSGSRDEIIQLDFAIYDKYFYTISLPAGGWVNVLDKYELNNELITFEAFQADGTPFPSTTFEATSA